MCTSLCTPIVHNTIQHRAVLIIFSPSLQTNIIHQLDDHVKISLFKAVQEEKSLTHQGQQMTYPQMMSQDWGEEGETDSLLPLSHFIINLGNPFQNDINHMHSKKVMIIAYNINCKKGLMRLHCPLFEWCKNPVLNKWFYSLYVKVLLLQPFYDPLSGTTQVSRHQKDKPFLILLKQTWWASSVISWTICKLTTLGSRR